MRNSFATWAGTKLMICRVVINFSITKLIKKKMKRFFNTAGGFFFFFHTPLGSCRVPYKYFSVFGYVMENELENNLLMFYFSQVY